MLFSSNSSCVVKVGNSVTTENVLRHLPAQTVAPSGPQQLTPMIDSIGNCEAAAILDVSNVYHDAVIKLMCPEGHEEVSNFSLRIIMFCIGMETTGCFLKKVVLKHSILESSGRMMLVLVIVQHNFIVKSDICIGCEFCRTTKN